LRFSLDGAPKSTKARLVERVAAGNYPRPKQPSLRHLHGVKFNNDEEIVA
jgi:hypothetical protein